MALFAFIVAVSAAPAVDIARRAVLSGDTNGDGMMDKTEFGLQLQKNAAFRKVVFKALDQDSDGVVDAEPFQALEKAKSLLDQTFEASDANGDGMLNKKEALDFAQSYMKGDVQDGGGDGALHPTPS